MLSASTPLARKVQRAIATAPNQPRKLTVTAEKARDRRNRAKIAQLQAFSIDSDNNVAEGAVASTSASFVVAASGSSAMAISSRARTSKELVIASHDILCS